MRKWLIEIRENSGLSQYEVATIAGVSQSYYAAIEVGERGSKLPTQTAKKIAKALKFKWTKFYE